MSRNIDEISVSEVLGDGFIVDTSETGTIYICKASSPNVKESTAAWSIVRFREVAGVLKKGYPEGKKSSDYKASERKTLTYIEPTV